MTTKPLLRIASLTTREQMVVCLDDMAAILATPEKWTKDVDARDIDGMPVAAQSDEAVCWCLNGAHSAARNPSKGHNEYDGTWTTLRRFYILWGDLPLTTEACLTRFNDAPSTTHDDVLAFLKAARDYFTEPNVAKDKE